MLKISIWYISFHRSFNLKIKNFRPQARPQGKGSRVQLNIIKVCICAWSLSLKRTLFRKQEEKVNIRRAKHYLSKTLSKTYHLNAYKGKKLATDTEKKKFNLSFESMCTGRFTGSISTELDTFKPRARHAARRRVWSRITLLHTLGLGQAIIA